MTPFRRTRTGLVPAALLVLGTPLVAQGRTAGAPDADLVARARAIHERVITLDTHADINVANFTARQNYTQRLSTQVNLPKMEEGGLDAAFFIVYVGQDDDFTPAAYRRAEASKRPAVLEIAVDFTPHPMDGFWVDVVLKGMELAQFIGK